MLTFPDGTPVTVKEATKCGALLLAIMVMMVGGGMLAAHLAPPLFPPIQYSTEGYNCPLETNPGEGIVGVIYRGKCVKRAP